MSLNTHWADKPNDVADPVSSNGANHVVLTVLDHMEARPELRQVLQLNGYSVIAFRLSGTATSSGLLVGPSCHQ